MSAELSKGGLTRKLNLQRGKCQRCGQSTMLFGLVLGGVFYGKRYCDDCVDWWDGEQERERLAAAEKRHGGKSFQRSDPRKEKKHAYALAKAWKPRSSNVFICGHVGTGKSYLASCIACHCESHYSLSVERLSALRFCDRVSIRFNSRSSGQMDELSLVSVLVIDDIDKGTWNSVSLTWLWEILDARRERCRSTIFTSNYAIVELERELEQYAKNKALPKAIMDRFRPYLEIVLTGDSIRQSEKTLQEAAGQGELLF